MGIGKTGANSNNYSQSRISPVLRKLIKLIENVPNKQFSLLLADCLPAWRPEPAVPVPGDVRAGGRLRAAPLGPHGLRVPLRPGMKLHYDAMTIKS